MSCCPHGETTFCQHGHCDECAHRQHHDEQVHEAEMRERERHAMLHDPTSDLYYTDGAIAMRQDAGWE